MPRTVATTIALCFALPPNGEVPEWVQVTPAPNAKGVITGDDGRTFNIDDVDKLVAALNATASRIPFDINHATASEAAEKGGASPSVGWPAKFENRSGAIWAKADWNDTGRNAIASKHYRFLSPAFYAVKDTGQVIGLHSIGLVNHPNFDMPALNARGNDTPEPTPGAPSMKRIAELLGLVPDASEDAICTAVNKLKSDHVVALNSAKQDAVDGHVPKEQHEAVVATNAKLQKRIDQINDQDIVDTVDGAVAAGKVAPAAKDYYIAQCRKDGGLAEFKTALETMPVIGDPSGLDTKEQPAKNAKGKPTAEDIAVCKLTGRDPATLYDDAKAA